MSAARALGAMYLATASVFGVALAFQQHPDWGQATYRATDEAGHLFDGRLVTPLLEAGRHQIVAAYDRFDPLPHVAVAHPKSVGDKSQRRRVFVASAPLTPQRHDATSQALVRLSPPSSRDLEPIPATPLAEVAPEIALSSPAPLAIAPAPPTQATPSPAMTLAPAPKSERPPTQPVEASIAPAGPRAAMPPVELSRVVARLKQNLTPEMLGNFELFLYVSKAEAGPWAQHMYVFAKNDEGGLDLRYNWLVSTGRERFERNEAGLKVDTFTPGGYYQLDPDRIYRDYTSHEWGQPMPYAMFFNWIHHGRETGLAIHAANGGDIARLGSRASAGCIHLSPENAATLFGLIRSHYRGLAPRFAYDRRTGTMSNDGILLHSPNGHLKFAEGYKVLVFIENYGGNENVVAALF